MQCPKCKAKTVVLETRTTEEAQQIRRRTCLDPECNYRFFTKEVFLKDVRQVTKERLSKTLPKKIEQSKSFKTIMEKKTKLETPKIEVRKYRPRRELDFYDDEEENWFGNA